MSTTMQASLFGDAPKLEDPFLSPVHEISAYEALWGKYSTVKKIADLFKAFNFALPSKVAGEIGIQDQAIEEIRKQLKARFDFPYFSALFNRDFEYPVRLREAEHPVEVLYYQGALELLSTRGVAIVGSRKPSEDGLKRARKIAKLMVENDFTVFSGLAEGIDTAAHTAAIEHKGRTVAVLGTSLEEFYPKSNRSLQVKIAREHLVISQVPFMTRTWHIKAKRNFFPERNKTMSALSAATIIVEASDTSGSLVQARAALQQKRKLFILKSCFERGLRWPDTYLRAGAIKVESPEEVLAHLKG